jgi:hypothetical protein
LTLDSSLTFSSALDGYGNCRSAERLLAAAVASLFGTRLFGSFPIGDALDGLSSFLLVRRSSASVARRSAWSSIALAACRSA